MFEVRLTRNGLAAGQEFVESVHRAAACMIDIDGVVQREATPGDAASRSFMRSAAKPFQAAAAVADGVLEAFGLDDGHLAVACGSHDGGNEAVALVTELLDLAGLTGDRVMAGDDGRGGGLRHQCSGNHALALAWCVHRGWPLDGYLDPGHPVQNAMARVLATVLRETPETAPDNCGMLAYRATLGSIARAFALMAAAPEVAAAPGVAAVPGLGRVAAAMRSHPRLVGGVGCVDTTLMEAVPGVVAKSGAEAILGIGSRDGLGVVVRVSDGSMRALGAAAFAVADRWLGIDVVPSADAGIATVVGAGVEVPVRDGRGRVIGALRPHGDLDATART
ncbi:MAG: asparaginase [Microthrixaceae bacterium]